MLSYGIGNSLDFSNSSSIITLFESFSSIYRHMMKKIDFGILQDFIFFDWFLLVTFQMTNWCWGIITDWQPKCLTLQCRNHFTSSTTICDNSNASRVDNLLSSSPRKGRPLEMAISRKRRFLENDDTSKIATFPVHITGSNALWSQAFLFSFLKTVIEIIFFICWKFDWNWFYTLFSIDNQLQLLVIDIFNACTFFCCIIKQVLETILNLFHFRSVHLTGRQLTKFR